MKEMKCWNERDEKLITNKCKGNVEMKYNGQRNAKMKNKSLKETYWRENAKMKE